MPTFASAEEDQTCIDLTAPDTPEPLITASTSDGGLWIVASASGRRQHQLLRLDANGNRTVALLLSNDVNSDNPDEFVLFPLADGGVLELDTGGASSITRCSLRSVTRLGVVRFEHDFEQSSCRMALGKSASAPFLLTSSAAASWVSEDGSLVSSFLVPDNSSLTTAELINDDAVVVQRGDSGVGYVLSRTSPNGSVRWSKPLEGVNGNLDVSVRGLLDGRAMILIFETGKVQQRFYSADGLLIETREIAVSELRSEGLLDWALDEQGNHALALDFRADVGQTRYGALVFASNGNFIKLVRYAPVGHASLNANCWGWQTNLPPHFAMTSVENWC